MKIAIESTNQMTTVDGAAVRLWKGTTEGGVKCQVFVCRLSADTRADCSEFEDLEETTEPRELIRVLFQNVLTINQTPGLLDLLGRLEDLKIGLLHQADKNTIQAAIDVLKMRASGGVASA